MVEAAAETETRGKFTRCPGRRCERLWTVVFQHEVGVGDEASDGDITEGRGMKISLAESFLSGIVTKAFNIDYPNERIWQKLSLPYTASTGP